MHFRISGDCEGRGTESPQTQSRPLQDDPGNQMTLEGNILVPGRGEDSFNWGEWKKAAGGGSGAWWSGKKKNTRAASKAEIKGDTDKT